MTDDRVKKGESASGDTSSGLLQLAKALDPAAWRRLVSLYTPLVYRWCRSFGLQPADAADIGQEVFRSVFRKLPEYHQNQQGDTFRGWLRTITENKVRDFGRAKPRERTGWWLFTNEWYVAGAAQVDDASPVPLDEQALLCGRIVELVRKEYRPDRWLAFWKVTVEDRPPRDVAEELGLTVNAVYLAKSRVLQRLKGAFADLENAKKA